MNERREAEPASVRDWLRARLGLSAAEGVGKGTGVLLPPHLEGFDARRWASSSPDERVGSMQQLEDHAAEQQGRKARPVVLDPGLGQGYGQFTGQHLSVNPKLAADGSSPYQAMQTVLHEGRHAYQQDAVRGVVTPDVPEPTVQSWRDNYQPGAYNDPATSPYHDYRFQPLEDDASKFTTASMQSQASQFAYDPGYQRFLTSDAAMTRKLEGVAVERRGPNFRETISADVAARASGPDHQGKETRRSRDAQQDNSANMDRVRMSFPLPADQAVGWQGAVHPVPWRGARAPARGVARGGRGG